MSTRLSIPQDALVEIPSPHVEPRIAFQSLEPRKVNNLTLVDGKTFLSTTVAGDVVPPGAPDVGLFHDDTRFLSHLELRVGGHRGVVLSSSTEKSFASQVELTTGNITLRNSFDLPENTVHIRREQLLNGQIFFDRFTFENFNLAPVDLLIELTFDADFVDVFQVRGLARSASGQYYRPLVRSDGLTFVYRGRDNLMRQTNIEMSPPPNQIEERTARWDIKLPSLQEVRIDIVITPSVGDVRSDGRARPINRDPIVNLRQRRQAYFEWERQSTHFRSSNEVFDSAVNTAISDFHALQIPDGDQHIIAAGIPWFATAFGRDSIIAAYQSLVLNPQLAADTLRVLARYQGTEYNDWRDEEPGKILHEYRNGEMTRAG